MQRGEEGPRELAGTGWGQRPVPQGCRAVRPDQGEQREAGAREALTHEVGQQDDQRG